jgi:DNA-binding CsgD family transcriptional regulator/tetratricopeptide (TPR) repeat protein
MLVDRRTERSALDSLIASARGGMGRALVLRGEPGIGKTALLEYAIESASGFRIARAAGVESEMELAFAALHQLCAPALDRLERLPGPQRDALGVAFGLRAGEAPDRFLVGLAVLSLLSEVAGERPLLCVVDDAQWLDRASAQALAFAARRLLAEPVALIFAAREPGEEFTGLPEQLVQGLEDTDARALLGSFLRVPLDEQVCERILTEMRGNPLALVELPRGLTPEELAGGFGVLSAPGLPDRIEQTFLRRYEALPPAARQLLLVAAAEPVGDPVLVWRAAGRLGIWEGAAAAAEADGLLVIGARVTFRHPLVRSAVYRAASPPERRAVHEALAEATDPEADPDRRAWHLAQAAPGPDEEVAAELERSAGRARARGGVAAAGAFLERVVALTLDPPRRADRALATAEAKLQVGALDAALGLLATAEAGPLNERQRARADLLRGQIAFVFGRGMDAPLLMLKAARQFEPLDVGMARVTYLEALSTAVFAGRLAVGGGAREVAEAARWAPASPRPAGGPDLLLDGLALLITEGYAAGTPVLKRALQAFLSEHISSVEAMPWAWLTYHAALILWDCESWRLLAARQVSLARDAGALVVLSHALDALSVALTWTGDFAAAAAPIAEREEIVEAAAASQFRFHPFGALQLAAWQGDEAKTMALIEGSLPMAVSRGAGMALAFIDYATAVLYNGLGRYEEALAAAQQASEYPQELLSALILPELIEAAVRSGQAVCAADALELLAETTRASRTDWALGTEARSRALLATNQVAEDHYREAIDHLGRVGLRVELARARLLYGEWLRRRRRRGDARDQLRAAYETFVSVGAGAFAERARIELRATGERAPKRTAQTRDVLTAREAHIARLAGQGASNPEIAAQLFISPATVAYHLRKVFAKLGISSRSQLAGALPAPPD